MKVILLKSAQKELDRIPDEIAFRISEKLLLLKNNPYIMGSEKLGGGKGYRIRIGDYRAIYTLDKKSKTISVVKVGHRRDVYRVR